MNAEHKPDSGDLHHQVNDLIPCDAPDVVRLIELIGQLRETAYREGLADGKRIYRRES